MICIRWEHLLRIIWKTIKELFIKLHNISEDCDIEDHIDELNTFIVDNIIKIGGINFSGYNDGCDLLTIQHVNINVASTNKLTVPHIYEKDKIFSQSSIFNNIENKTKLSKEEN